MAASLGCFRPPTGSKITQLAKAACPDCRKARSEMQELVRAASSTAVLMLR